MSNNNLLRPDFTEDLVGFMVQSMLTISRFPRAPFALVPLSKTDEVIYGADALIESISPIYIQFKRSFAYPEYSASRIIKDRKGLKIDYSPKTLFFDLRAKKPHHTEFQHNALFDLKSQLDSAGKGKAFYAAPLFLNRTAYLLAVHMSALLSWRPWHYFRDYPFLEQTQTVLTSTGSIRFHNIPILKEHIVIPPHAKVTTHKHRYSYLETGTEVCFHEPTQVDGANSLGQEIYDFLRFRDGQPTTEMIGFEDSRSFLADLSSGITDLNSQQLGDNISNRWIAFGEYLRKEFEIFQFGLIKLRN